MASKLGVTSITVTRWCESGKLPATSKPYGKKTTWLISPSALELVVRATVSKAEKREAEAKERQQNKPHSSYQPAWVQAMAKGFITGKPFSKCTVKDYEYYANLYFNKHEFVSVEGLKSELSRIPIAQISKRQHFYKAIVCLAKFLIRENALDESFLKDSKILFPKRHLPPKRLVIDETGVNALLAACKTVQERLIILLLVLHRLEGFGSLLFKLGRY